MCEHGTSDPTENWSRQREAGHALAGEGEGGGEGDSGGVVGVRVRVRGGVRVGWG